MIQSVVFDEQTQTFNVIFRASEDAEQAVLAARTLGDDVARLIGAPTVAQFAATGFFGRLFAREADPLTPDQRAQVNEDERDAARA